MACLWKHALTSCIYTQTDGHMVLFALLGEGPAEGILTNDNWTTANNNKPWHFQCICANQKNYGPQRHVLVIVSFPRVPAAKHSFQQQLVWHSHAQSVQNTHQTLGVYSCQLAFWPIGLVQSGFGCPMMFPQWSCEHTTQWNA